MLGRPGMALQEKRQSKRRKSEVLDPLLAAQVLGTKPPPAPSLNPVETEVSLLQYLSEQLRIERSFLQTILQQLPSGVVIASAPSGALTMGNLEVERIWRASFKASRSIAEYDEYIGFHPDGSRYKPEEWPMSRAILRGEEVRGERIKIQRGDNTFGYISINAAPIRDSNGKIIAGVVTINDITELMNISSNGDFSRKNETRKKSARKAEPRAGAYPV